MTLTAAERDYIRHEPMPESCAGEIGTMQQFGPVGMTDQFRKMLQRAGGLLAAHHDEMVWCP
jgi:hypothetical protein